MDLIKDAMDILQQIDAEVERMKDERIALRASLTERAKDMNQLMRANRILTARLDALEGQTLAPHTAEEEHGPE